MKQSPQHLLTTPSMPAVKRVPSGAAQFNLYLYVTEEPVIGTLPSAQKCSTQKNLQDLGTQRTSVTEPPRGPAAPAPPQPCPTFLLTEELGL